MAEVAIDVYEDAVAVVDPDPVDPDPVDPDPVDPDPVVVEPDPVPSFLLFGKVEEDGTEQPIDHELTLYEEEGNKLVGKVQPDKQGNYEIRLPGGKEYRIDVNFCLPLSALGRCSRKPGTGGTQFLYCILSRSRPGRHLP